MQPATRALAGFLLLVPVALPVAAQEWCNAAPLNRSEQAICADPILGDLDREMTALYLDGPRDRAAQDRWLRERDRCGADIFCIEDRYRDRIAALSNRTPVRRSDLRPWCDAARLNATEAVICSDETLADMDAALEAVYGAARASDSDAAQVHWLRERRDACGTDKLCIGNAYLRRIVELGRRLREGG